MMTPQDSYSKLVVDWEKKSARGLSSDQLAQLLEKAIQALVKRANLTLSSITLMAILDRVLHQSQEQFPILIDVAITSQVLNFDEFYNNKSIKADEAVTALRFLLVEMLRILGRITADILTPPLHNELLKVTWNDETEKK